MKEFEEFSGESESRQELLQTQLMKEFEEFSIESESRQEFLQKHLLEEFDEFSKKWENRHELFEKHLMDEISKAYSNHTQSLKKMSDDTWTAFDSTGKKLKNMTASQEILEHSLGSLNLENRKQVDDFRALFDTSLEALEKANQDFKARMIGLSEAFESSKRDVSQDLKQHGVLIEEVAKNLASKSKVLESIISTSDKNSKNLLEETKKELEKTLLSSRQAIENKSAQEISRIDSRLTKVAEKIDQELTSLVQRGNTLESVYEKNGQRINSIQLDLVNVKETEESFMRHIRHQNQITRNIENLVNRSNSFNYNTFQVFDRRFIRKDYEDTLKPILNLFGLSMSFNTVGYLAHKICKIEEDCVGRLATNIQDALIRLISVFGLKREKCKILEIGTLFGINLCIIEELGAAYGKDLSYQVIDPLDGYYKKGQLDIVTKQEVNSRNFWYNIKKCGLQSEKFELIKGFSHHKVTIRKVKKNSIDLVFVDGDHTRKGVALDIRNYYQTLRKGGYFLFDDYGSSQWPEVKEAVDASRIVKSHFKFVGHAFRTAIYEKK